MRIYLPALRQKGGGHLAERLEALHRCLENDLQAVNPGYYR